MNNKHKKTLKAIFTDPVPSDIRWDDVKSLWLTLNAVVEQRAGSRVAVLLNDEVGHFHQPHLQQEIPKWTVKKIREFFENAGIEPIEL